ncbi:NfeD family protein [Candidatus Thorarchaeota archaeon]|jgi:membrane protein implicated in regulation of membrane protease activity|nr:MAG: NfeD family protein [Candidatus Thorarchaeota archaeon]
MVKLSPTAKFILITIDELVLVPIALVLVWLFAPEYLLPVFVITIIGAAIFVVIKYYIVYPTLTDEYHRMYELEGMIGRVIEPVSRESGKIKVGSEIWDARYDEGELPVGTEVEIVSRESMRVQVKPHSR